MNPHAQPLAILLADDDSNDRFMIRNAVEKSRIDAQLYIVEDGQEALDFLRGTDKYADATDRRRPDLLLLDLNMPRKGGLDTLKEIRQDPELSTLAVVVLTTSEAESDILRTYDLGANWFLTKPATVESLTEMVKFLGNHWQAIADQTRAKIDG
jgi:CheY-like chemotaxis protein